MAVAVDIVEIGQVAASLDRFGARYAERVYTPGEIAHAFDAPPSAPARLAARFAAKEAVVKLLRPGDVGIDPRNIEVVVATDGAPGIVLAGAAERLAAQRGMTRFSVSMSHDGGYAVAVVSVERDGPQWSPSRLCRRRTTSWTRTSRSGTSSSSTRS